jgi:hypothetical protein
MSAQRFESFSLLDVVIVDPWDARCASKPVLQRDPHQLFITHLREQISRRAYEIAAQRGFAPGNEQEDWLRAEQEVLAAPNS